MNIYAQVINGVPTGRHQKFETQPEGWLPVVYDTPVGSVTCDPVSQMVNADRSVINGAVHYAETVVPLPLEAVRANKLRALQAEYDAVIEAGYADPVSGRTLLLTKNSRDAFHSYFTKQEYKVRNGLSDQTLGLIADIDDQPIVGLTLAQIFTILSAYGDYYEQQWQRIAVANAALQAASTVQDVLAVTL